MNIKTLMLQSGQMVVTVDIQDLKGSYLLRDDKKYFEKGFIGEFLVTKIYEP